MHPITQRKAQVTRTTIQANQIYQLAIHPARWLAFPTVIQANHIHQLAQLFTRQHPPKTKRGRKPLYPYPPLEQAGVLPVVRVAPSLPQQVGAKLRWRAWARLEE